MQDSCVASVGEEVTYHYLVGLHGGYALVEVFDDKLGLIGQSTGEPLTRTTTLTETTTNTAQMTLIELDPQCYNLCSDPIDQVTVTVVTRTPTPTPTASPTATPPSPTASPTAEPRCEDLWPVDSIVTIAKGQSATNNLKVSHLITGNIIDPASLCSGGGPCTASRIPVCAGTAVRIAVTGSTNNTNIGRGAISCGVDGCSIDAVDVTEKYKSVSADGKDTDRVTLLPR